MGPRFLDALAPQFLVPLEVENGGEKVGHGSDGVSLLRAA